MGPAAGFVIIFVVSFVGFSVWTMLYLVFVSHYYLTTLVDSSSGHDEVHYPSETIMDWWWKPFLCLWILAFWVVSGSLLLSPLLAFSGIAFLIAFAALIWIAFPVSVLSVLHSGNWFFFFHPIIFWRMLRHYPAFAYTHVVTLLAFAICVGLVGGSFGHSFLWALPAAFVIPAAILFYSRQWGRFTWLALNFLPRKKKRPLSDYEDPPNVREPRDWRDYQDDAPEMAVQEVDEALEGVREGLPPAYPHAYQAGVPATPDGIVAGPAPSAAARTTADEADDDRPYEILGPSPQFAMPVGSLDAAPAASAPAAAPLAPMVEEEDEWATNKKPYPVFEERKAEAAATATEETKANKPISAAKYYGERAQKEHEEKRQAKADAETLYMPTLSKKTPAFYPALVSGVWSYMIYERTLRVWANLVLLTIVELFFLVMVVRFWPNLG